MLGLRGVGRGGAQTDTDPPLFLVLRTMSWPHCGHFLMGSGTAGRASCGATSAAAPKYWDKASSNLRKWRAFTAFSSQEPTLHV